MKINLEMYFDVELSSGKYIEEVLVEAKVSYSSGNQRFDGFSFRVDPAEVYVESIKYKIPKVCDEGDALDDLDVLEFREKIENKAYKGDYWYEKYLESVG